MRTKVCFSFRTCNWQGTRAFNIAHLELSLGDCHIAIVTVVTQFRHCRSWISLLVFIFVCWSVMNVVMVLDNNQNNILPYRSRFLQMPKVEIQGLFNAHITFTIDSNCSTSYCQYEIVGISGYKWLKDSIQGGTVLISFYCSFFMNSTSVAFTALKFIVSL